jgi:hypothetical protein
MEWILFISALLPLFWVCFALIKDASLARRTTIALGFYGIFLLTIAALWLFYRVAIIFLLFVALPASLYFFSPVLTLFALAWCLSNRGYLTGSNHETKDTLKDRISYLFLLLITLISLTGFILLIAWS